MLWFQVAVNEPIRGLWNEQILIQMDMCQLAIQFPLELQQKPMKFTNNGQVYTIIQMIITTEQGWEILANCFLFSDGY